MNASTSACLHPTTTFHPAVKVADYFTPEAAFMAAGFHPVLATIAGQEVVREPEKLACVDLEGSLASGGQRPAQAAWEVLNPRACEACVRANPDGTYTLYAGYAAKSLSDEAVMEGLICELQQASGLQWIAVTRTRMPWIAARAAQSSNQGLRGPTE